MIEKCLNSGECRFELRTALFKICVLELCCRLATLFTSKNMRGFKQQTLHAAERILHCVVLWMEKIHRLNVLRSKKDDIFRDKKTKS